MAYARGGAFSELGRGLSGLGATLMELRQREQDEAHRRELEDLNTALALADRGGGMGAVPTVEGTVRGSRQPLAFEAPSFIPEPTTPLSASSLIPDVPTFGSPEGIDYSMPDPNMVSVGPGYIERPGVAEARDRARLQEAYGAIRPDLDPSVRAGMAEVAGHGFSPTSLLPRETDPAEGVNWQTVTDAQGNMWQVHPRTGEKRPLGLTGRVPGSGSDRPIGVPTYNQARERLRQDYWRYDDPATPEDEGGPLLSTSQMHDLATRMARGEDVSLPDPASLLPPPPAPEPEMVPKPGFRGWLERALPFGETGFEPEPTVAQPSVGPARTAATGLGGPSDDEVRAAAQSISTLPPEQQREILIAEGATEDQVRRVLGGR